MLFSAYPDGIKTPDSHGNLPLHLAFIFNADDNITSLLMRKFPASLHVMNNEGLQPIQCSSEVSSETFQSKSELFGALSDYTRAIAENDPEKLADQLQDVRRQLKAVNDTLFAATPPRQPEPIKKYLSKALQEKLVEEKMRSGVMMGLGMGFCPLAPGLDYVDQPARLEAAPSQKRAEPMKLAIDIPQQACRVMEYNPKKKAWKEV
jgi:hypothetical protein